MSRLSNAYQYRVICEDKQMEIFARRFLENQGIDVCRKVYFDIAPNKECGEAYVKRNLPKHMQVIRSMNYNRIAVIAFTDADTETVEDRRNRLLDELSEKGIAFDKSKDLMFALIPKRNIETWIVYFEDENANIGEDKDYGHLRNPATCKPMAIKMSEKLKRGELSHNRLSSLAFAQKEYDRVCAIQNK